MSKRLFKEVTKANRVIAIPSKEITNSKGEVVKTLYDIVKLG